MNEKKFIEVLETFAKQFEIVTKDERTALNSFLIKDISSSIAEAFEYIYFNNKISKIENKVNQQDMIDFPAILSLEKKLKEFSYKEYKFKTTERVIDPSEHLKKLETNFKGIKSKPYSSVAYSFTFIYDSIVNELLLCQEEQKTDLNEYIYQALKLKLDKINSEYLTNSWFKLKRSILDGNFSVDGNSIPKAISKQFLKDDISFEQIKKNYAYFLSTLKPILVNDLLRNNISRHPVIEPGIVSIIASSKNDFYQVTQLEKLIIDSLSQVVGVFEALTYSEASHLAASMQLTMDNYIFKSSVVNETKKHFEKYNEKAIVEHLVLIFNRLVSLIDIFKRLNSNLEELLWKYKLGQEVLGNERSKEVAKMNEIKLQCEISKYLIENDILSFGRVFGRSQIDLYTKDFPDSTEYVIEVKVIRKTKLYTKHINAIITQLSSYMSQISQPKGIVVIYNLTDELLIAPDQWLEGQIRIIIVNLCSSSPSSRKVTAYIKSISANSMEVEIFRTDQEGTKKVSKKAKKKVSKKVSKKAKKKISKKTD